MSDIFFIVILGLNRIDVFTVGPLPGVWLAGDLTTHNAESAILSNKQTTLLDFAVILQLLTVNKSSKIPYIWFTVNYCNTHCIMGIFY